MFKTIIIVLLFALTLFIFSCNDNPASNPIVFDDSDLFINNDSTLIDSTEHFNGIIFDINHIWIDRTDRRQSVHGWNGWFEENNRLMSYQMGFNTYPVHGNDYFLQILTPKFNQFDFNKLKSILTLGEKVLGGNEINSDNSFRISLNVVDETAGDSAALHFNTFTPINGNQDGSYFRIISRFVKYQYEHYMVKIKAELNAKLYDEKGLNVGTIKSNSLILGVYIEKKLFDNSR